MVADMSGKVSAGHKPVTCKGVHIAVRDERPPFDWGIVFRMIACLLLGGGLFLFIRNNDLLAHGGRNLLYPEALIMFAVLGIPFILVLLHLVRGFRQPDQ